MGLKEELRSQVVDYLKRQWDVRTMRTVPELGQVQLLNDGVKIEATVLYADMVGSSELVKKYPATFAATVYKAYLNSACRIIKDQGGEIRAFDGDRVMAVFTDEPSAARAVSAAFLLTFAVNEIINSELAYHARRTGHHYKLQHCVGIDTSELLVARTGIRGDNDLVWVGNAANKAAKLCSQRGGNFTTYITDKVFSVLPDNLRYSTDGPIGGLIRTTVWSQILRGVIPGESIDYGATAHIKFS